MDLTRVFPGPWSTLGINLLLIVGYCRLIPVLAYFEDVLGVRLHAWDSVIAGYRESLFTRASLFPDRERIDRALGGYLHKAWAEARHDGIDHGAGLAQACLFAALHRIRDHLWTEEPPRNVTPPMA